MSTDPPSTWVKEAPIAATTTLWAAARANDVLQLARLLDRGEPIDERDSRGYAPLMLAGYLDHLEAVELLLARGADPNTRELFGNTVLMGAAYKGFVRIVQRLLAAGADPSLINNGGLDARGFALTYGRVDVFAVLDQYAQRSGATTPLVTPLPAPLTTQPKPLVSHTN
jgi:ankyrin repeat protein